MSKHESINYVEFPSRDMQATKAFFESCFGWTFTEYGPDYMSYSGETIEAGFFKSDQSARTANGSALVVLYSERLEETLAKVEKCGGTIVQPIFSFPGGRRFQFAEPSGTELAVWTDVKPG
ncbi:VOC family protein [Rhodopirellula sp. SWK7]|uniref:VOC family protein n=1 Tax=Rhodopirellula sp. SWK7 TaxID=595460 RepID=UPI0002BF67D3|nr:VOC family protein [Rhodopirellula sp. SWK7]EMI45015.1 glyoxalase/bleomycin resistance protein/dioxygenase [Rhodopirellula sp. SWK7]